MSDNTERRQVVAEGVRMDIHEASNILGKISDNEYTISALGNKRNQRRGISAEFIGDEDDSNTIIIPANYIIMALQKYNEDLENELAKTFDRLGVKHG